MITSVTGVGGGPDRLGQRWRQYGPQQGHRGLKPLWDCPLLPLVCTELATGMRTASSVDNKLQQQVYGIRERFHLAGPMQLCPRASHYTGLSEQAAVRLVGSICKFPLCSAGWWTLVAAQQQVCKGNGNRCEASCSITMCKDCKCWPGFKSSSAGCYAQLLCLGVGRQQVNRKGQSASVDEWAPWVRWQAGDGSPVHSLESL